MQHLTYEYARRGACLLIIARRENLLKKVAEKAGKLGSPDVVPLCADVLKVDDRKRKSLMNLFSVDVLVNNAGIGSMCLIEDVTDITKLAPVMASKAALLGFFETMRVELAPEISITTATLGIIESEITKGKHLSKEGTTQVNSDLANAYANQLPVMSSSACAKVIVDAIRRKERNVTEPKWYRVLFLLKTLCPELIEWGYDPEMELRYKA
ncbi:hypothetical protein ACH5RR_006644 [Cinchona calisaya]|uniref:Uncharacterized protein n=1 Tax=Cinchona calisaya TaxID=153742 RepID=A0ABD3APK2_9GENT